MNLRIKIFVVNISHRFPSRLNEIVLVSNTMKRILLLFTLVLTFSICTIAQKDTAGVGPAAAAKDDAPNALAKLTLAAHGGDKMRKVKSLMVRGSVDVTSSMFNQALPATFVSAYSGQRYLFELTNPMQPLKQVYDGRNTYSSVQGMSLPPVPSVGFPVLSHIGEIGYQITSLPEAKKKKAGFRLTTPEGYYTDFFTDEKTNLIKGYESSYDVGGRTVTTSVEIDKFLIVDGVQVPDKYSQRFDLGSMTAWANFKTKQILVNPELTDDVFTLTSK